MSGLTNNGLEIKRLADIKLEIENELKAELGESINLIAPSVFSVLVGIFAERESLLWELAEDVYNSQYPDTATGTSLDNVAALTGITRLSATKSIVQNVSPSGTAGTVLPAGTIFSVEGNEQARFLTDNAITLPNTVDCTAETAGFVQAFAGTLTVIETPVTGLDAVSNPEDAITGREAETDAELRQRRLESLQIAGAGTVEAIISTIKNLDDVEDAIIFENDDDEVVDGRPPHSFELVVSGGEVDDIAKAIWESKPVGIQTFGSASASVLDSQGNTQTVKFSRPTEVDIYLEVDLTVDSTFPASGESDVSKALVTRGNEFGIGGDVIVIPRLISVLNNFDGILDADVRIGTTVSPTASDNISIAADEISVFDTTRTTVITV